MLEHSAPTRIVATGDHLIPRLFIVGFRWFEIPTHVRHRFSTNRALWVGGYRELSGATVLEAREVGFIIFVGIAAHATSITQRCTEHPPFPS
jgi:hypothetical protein